MCVPKISAIIHATNEERRLGRALETLRACDEIIVVDHGSKDRTIEIAKEYGATVRQGVLGVNPGAYIVDLKYDWVLCLLPCESLSESLEASLFEWKHQDEPPQDGSAAGYCVAVREETARGWKALPSELRLVNRTRMNWTEELPPNECPAPELPGEILRFSTS